MPSARHVMREWITRVVSGYWTHAGYMNWDSGLGFNRWHQGKKLGLTQEALVGLASSDTLLPSAKWGQWAKSMLDNGFDFYSRLSQRSKDGLVDPVLFDVTAVPQGVGSARLAAARVQANAARAVDAGLGAKKAATPPPLYSYDPDIGRLAVTTPTYNTAVVAVNQNAFPYGGLDLARFYDGQQEVAANIGGRPPASFGMLVRDVGGKRVTASQVGRTRVTRGVRPAAADQGPDRRRRRSRASTSAAPTPGPFSDLRATGTTRGPRACCCASRTASRGIGSRRPGRRPVGPATAATPPTCSSRAGAATAAPGVVAVLRDGTRVTVGSKQIKLASIAYLWVQSEHSGYVVVPASRPSGAAVHVMRPARAELGPEARPDAGDPDRPRAALQPRRRCRPASCPCTTSRKPRPRRRGWDDDVVGGPRLNSDPWLSVPSSRGDGPPRSSC